MALEIVFPGIDGQMIFSVTDTGWTRCRLITATAQVCGYEGSHYFYKRLVYFLDMPFEPFDHYQEMEVMWVFSVFDPLGAVYAARHTHGFILFFQSRDARTFSELRISHADILIWRQRVPLLTSNGGFI